MERPLPPTDPPGWTVVVPVKRLAQAKTRLDPLSPGDRAALALAFALDTVTAALAVPRVCAVLVVTDDPSARARLQAIGAEVVADEPDAGLNPALHWGARIARVRRPEVGVCALSADLPALRAHELSQVLDAALALGSDDRPVVLADRHHLGTTAYLSGPCAAFAPEFGADSLRRHLTAGAVAIEGLAVASVRTDVDTLADLIAADALGLGAATAHAWGPLRASPGVPRTT